MGELSAEAVAILLTSLRVMPALAFAPPFTLIRTPAIIRVVLSVSLAVWLVRLGDRATITAAIGAGDLLLLAAHELLLGVLLALTLQLAFAAIAVAGRVLDIQAGFGLVLLVDPALRSQTPLIGTLYAYAAGAVFFSFGGATDLLALLAASVETAPLGGALREPPIEPLLRYLALLFFLAMGLIGFALAALFVVDLSIALMSRTMPQMNVLVLGFQVKTLVLLVALAAGMGASGAFLARILRLALETAGELMRT